VFLTRVLSTTFFSIPVFFFAKPALPLPPTVTRRPFPPFSTLWRWSLFFDQHFLCHPKRLDPPPFPYQYPEKDFFFKKSALSSSSSRGRMFPPPPSRMALRFSLPLPRRETWFSDVRRGIHPFFFSGNVFPPGEALRLMLRFSSSPRFFPSVGSYAPFFPPSPFGRAKVPFPSSLSRSPLKIGPLFSCLLGLPALFFPPRRGALFFKSGSLTFSIPSLTGGPPCARPSPSFSLT